MKTTMKMSSRFGGFAAAVLMTLTLGGCPLVPPEDPSLLDYTGGDNDPALGVASVTITAHGSTSLETGGTVQLSATAYNSVGQQITAEFQWTSSNSSIASVNQSGVVTAKSTAGSCVVSACAGGKCDEANIVVSEPAVAVQGVVLAGGTGEGVLQLGQTRQLTVVISYVDGTTSTDATRVAFSGSFGSVVTISASGLLTASGIGSVSVTASAGGVTSNALPFITEAASIAISCEGTTAVAAGTALQCTVVARDTSDVVVQGLASGTFTLTSPQQGTLISSIGSSGLVATLQAGDGLATLNASHTTSSTQRTLTATYELDVVRVTSVTVEGVTTDLVAGDTRTFTATLARQSGGAVPADVTVSWESLNNSVVTPQQSTGTTVTVNAPGIGNAELTAYAGTANDSVAFRTVPASVVLTGSNEVNQGATTQLVATAQTSAGATAYVDYDATIAWQTSASGTATVAANGVTSGAPRATVTGVLAGTATITATVNGVADTHDITVVNVSQFPSFAGIVTAMRTSTTGVQLSWAAATDAQSASSALIYEVRRSSTGPANWDVIPAVLTTGAGVTTIPNTVPMRGETYTYNVRAVDPQGNRDSNTATADVFMPDANPVTTGGVPYLVGKTARWASISGTTLTDGRTLGPVVEATSTTKETTGPRFLADGKLVGIRVAEGDQQKVYVRNDDGSFTDVATITLNTGTTAGVSTPGIGAAFGLFGSNTDKLAYTKDSAAFPGKVDLVVYDRDNAATLQVASGITRAAPLSTGHIAVIFFGNIYVVDVPADLTSGSIGFNPVTTAGGYDSALLFGRNLGAGGQIIALKGGATLTAELWDATARTTLAAPTFAGTVPNLIGGLVLWTGTTAATHALAGHLVVQSYVDATHSKLYLVNLDTPTITNLTPANELGAPNLETVNPG